MLVIAWHLLGDHGREFPTTGIRYPSKLFPFGRDRMKEFAKARVVVTPRHVKVGCLLSFRKRTAVHIGIQ